MSTRNLSSKLAIIPSTTRSSSARFTPATKTRPFSVTRMISIKHGARRSISKAGRRTRQRSGSPGILLRTFKLIPRSISQTTTPIGLWATSFSPTHFTFGARRNQQNERGQNRRATEHLLQRFLSVLGPGLITGAADDDPSGVATYTIAGAQLGTSLLWTAFITWPLMGC